MKKKEWIYRELACNALKERGARFTQLGLSRKFGISLSTVHNAIFPLVQNGIVSPLSRGCRLSDLGKLLAFWGTQRKLAKDVVWSGWAASVSEAEKAMPSGIVWGGCTAYRRRHNEGVADYSTGIVYADQKEAAEAGGRFRNEKGNARVLVLGKDPFLAGYADKGICPDPQVYVDLWNLNDWQSARYKDALGKRMGLYETVLE